MLAMSAVTAFMAWLGCGFIVEAPVSRDAALSFRPRPLKDDIGSASTVP